MAYKKKERKYYCTHCDSYYDTQEKVDACTNNWGAMIIHYKDNKEYSFRANPHRIGDHLYKCPHTGLIVKTMMTGDEEMEMEQERIKHIKHKKHWGLL